MTTSASAIASTTPAAVPVPVAALAVVPVAASVVAPAPLPASAVTVAPAVRLPSRLHPVLRFVRAFVAAQGRLALALVVFTILALVAPFALIIALAVCAWEDRK